MTNPRTHALYRFYDGVGALLYVGITMDPGQRWRAHRDDKPWWHEVTTVTVETHFSRQAVLEAELEAIINEKPRYNVVHNRGTAATPRLVPQLDRIAPFQLGDWVALGLRDGRCPVGEITALDDQWVSLRLKDFWHGTLSARIVAVRWAEVEHTELAYPEDADSGPSRHDAGTDVKVMNDQHLGIFQTAWQRSHFGDGKHPLDQAVSDVLRDEQDRRDAREARRP